MIRSTQQRFLLPPALRDASAQRVLIVTKKDVQRTALSAVLDGHSSLSGASEVVRNAYGVEISKTSISRLLSALALHCHIMDALFTMENICTVAADEIFQGQTPIFTVIDLDSFYIACISDMPDRTAETWELTMRCLKDDSGLDPEVFITDNCGALQNGLSSAYEDDKVIESDIFHAERGLGTPIATWERQMYALIAEEAECEEAIMGSRPRKSRFDRLEELWDTLPAILEQFDQIFNCYQEIKYLLGIRGYNEKETQRRLNRCLDQMVRIASRCGSDGHHLHGRYR